MRLDTYLAESGIGTKKKVKEYVRQNRICINGEIAQHPSQQILEEKDVITFDGKRLNHRHKQYYMFHKPAGCITARSDETHETVMSYLQGVEKAGVFPVGRLDKDTEGLLLLTNDGKFNHLLMKPECHVQKRYFFWAFGEMNEEKKQKIEQGMQIEKEDKLTAPARLEIVSTGNLQQMKEYLPAGVQISKKKDTEYANVFSGYLTISEGRKHQVKRMLKGVGCCVIYLKRVSIGSLQLDEKLQPGEYRELKEEEIRNLLEENIEGLI